MAKPRRAPAPPAAPICAHPRRREVDRFDGVPLYECLDCALVFREPTDADRNPGDLYDDFYKNELSARFPSPVEIVVRMLRFYRALKIFTISPRARTILDIGSGRGFTLHYLRKFYRYRRAAGIQISRPALEFSRDVLGLEVRGQDFLEDDWSDARFDVVSMWHVMEHVIDPERYLAKIRSVLGPEGRFIVEVPNLDSWTRRLSGKYWLGYDLRYHLTFFSPRSLAAMLERHGFQATLVHTFSMEYSTFLSAQSLVGRITGADQLFYRWLQGVKTPPLRGLLHGALVAIFSPFCLAVNLALFLTRRGEVLCVVAKKT